MLYLKAVLFQIGLLLLSAPSILGDRTNISFGHHHIWTPTSRESTHVLEPIKAQHTPHLRNGDVDSGPQRELDHIGHEEMPEDNFRPSGVTSGELVDGDFHVPRERRFPQSPSKTPTDGRSAVGFPSGSHKVRGVSLGGWLVIEPWIKPSLFENLDDTVVDEYTFCQHLGREEATKRLQAHWDSWITEQDLQEIASCGLNLVRIPIGYWSVDISGGEPYAQGQYEYLKRGIGWAGKYGLKVMVDLHGAPGSQNGFDNSGRRGSIEWANSQAAIDRTKNVIRILSTEFSQPKYRGIVTAIQPINEPAGFAGDPVLYATQQYLRDAYEIIRYPTRAEGGDGTASDLLIAIPDAFQPLWYWQSFISSAQFQSVALEAHIYTVFSTGALQMTPSQRIQFICNQGPSIKGSNNALMTIIGEFTPADTDCAPGLLGRNLGSRYEGTFAGSFSIGSCQGKTGNGSTFSASFKQYLRRFWEAQVSAYEANGSGWIMWTWKTETADEWSYQKGVEYGWIPKDPTHRIYGEQCS